jgi:hypothetical protein
MILCLLLSMLEVLPSPYFQRDLRERDQLKFGFFLMKFTFVENKVGQVFDKI